MDGLLSRLEAVTIRLEAMAKKTVPGVGVADAEIDSVTATSSGSGVPPSVAAFDELIASQVAKLGSVSGAIGGKVEEAAHIVLAAFQAQRKIVLAISRCKKPSPNDPSLQELFAPLIEQFSKANALTEGRRTELYNHFKSVAESLQSLAWVAYSGKECGMSLPGPHVEETWQSAEFFTNKILKDFRSKDEKHVEWSKSLKEIFVPSLRDYAKSFHTTGPSWNDKGIDLAEYLKSPAGEGVFPTEVSASKAKGPPPPPSKGPPPPPPPKGPLPSSSPSSSSGVNMSKLLEDINKGESVTAGLRKVTPDMKSKNQPGRSSIVPASSAPPTSSPSPSEINASSKSKPSPPVLELQNGRKWMVSNQVNEKTIVIKDTEVSQSVYIFKCQNSVIQIQGKVNNICLDSCKKTGILFQDVVAAFEIVNCSSVEVQCQGHAPTIAIDNTSGCQLYLSEHSLGASITSAKSSQINVLVPGKTPEEDLVEHPLPEQYSHTFVDGQFVTTPVSHSG